MRLTTRDLTEIAIFTALLSVTSWISVPVFGVPVTIQTLLIMLIGLLLSPRNGVMVVISYLIIGAIGIPVFSQGKGGIGVIFGPTGGFLISFVFGTFMISKMKIVNFINNRFFNTIIILLLANIIIYLIGWSWLAIYNDMGLALTLKVLWPFAIIDFVKMIVASYVYLNMYSYVTYERA